MYPFKQYYTYINPDMPRSLRERPSVWHLHCTLKVVGSILVQAHSWILYVRGFAVRELIYVF